MPHRTLVDYYEKFYIFKSVFTRQLWRIHLSLISNRCHRTLCTLCSLKNRQLPREQTEERR